MLLFTLFAGAADNKVIIIRLLVDDPDVKKDMLSTACPIGVLGSSRDQNTQVLKSEFLLFLHELNPRPARQLSGCSFFGILPYF